MKNQRKKLKKAYFGQKASELNELNEVRNVQKLFAKAKDYRILQPSDKTTIPTQKLQDHFQAHFGKSGFSPPEEITSPEKFPFLDRLKSQIPINEDPPTTDEVQSCFKNLKNSKCQGTDLIFGECLKYADCDILTEKVTQMLCMVWEGEEQPEVWKLSRLKCMWKRKGSKQDETMYRGLSVGAISSKILPMVLLGRIRAAYESMISPNQYGFRQQRSTTDGIFILKNLIEKTNTPFVATFIDLKAAYDWVPRDSLIKVFEFRTGATKIAKMLAEGFRNTKAQITGSKEQFSTTCGLKQGALESPVLFNIYFDFCIFIAKEKINQDISPGKVSLKFNIKIECLGPRELRTHGDSHGEVEVDEEEYADDLVGINTNIEEARQCLVAMDETFKKFGLTISFGKTETMLFGFPEEDAARTSLFEVSGEAIKNVRSFTYLGHSISNLDVNEIDTSSLDLRISLAKGKFQELKKVLCDRDIQLPIRANFLQTFVRSRLLYAVQCWDLREAEIKRLEACWHGLLRRMVNNGFRKKEPQVEDSYALFYNNEDLVRITGTVPLRRFIHEQQIRYTAHLCRLPNTDMRKQILFSQGRRYSRSIWKKLERLLNLSEIQLRKDMMDRARVKDLLDLL